MRRIGHALKILVLIPDEVPRGVVGRVTRALPLIPGCEARTIVSPVQGLLDRQGWRRLYDTIQAFQPHLLHVIGERPLETMAIWKWATGELPCPLVASGIDSLGWGFTRWKRSHALRVASRILYDLPSQLEMLRGAPQVSDRLTPLPLGVLPAPGPSLPDGMRKSLGIPEEAKLIVAIGRCDDDPWLRMTPWAFDVAKYLDPRLHLVFIGDGPRRARTEQFSRAIGDADFRATFLGNVADPAPWIGSAEQVWVIRSRGGASAALEGMAAGKLVLTMQSADMANILEHRKTGLLLPPQDPVAFADGVRDMLDHPDVGQAIVFAARQATQIRFPMSEVAERLATVYHDVVTGPRS